jgi:glycosyltransferase involved in cell wall biosynthesis
VRPRMTIIVPTRERSDTLRWALKTCVTQEYDNFEILVSDNASTDATRDVVQSYDDPRIRYVNPGQRLGMSEHWEFAFSHVTDGYVGVIGDDDGLLPSAIEDVSTIVGSSGLPLTWPLQQYFWPSYPDPALADSLILPMPQKPEVREVDTHSAVSAVLKDYGRYPILPSPYFGIVPVALFDAIKRRSGSIFHSITPDIYAGFAVAAVCETYLRSDQSYSLAGQSSHSNGASQLSGRGEGDEDSPASKYNRENTIPFHQDLTMAPSIPIVVVEAAMQARDRLGLDVTIDLERMIDGALRDPSYVLNPAVRPLVDAALAQIAETHGLVERFDRQLSRSSHLRRVRYLREGLLSLLVRHPLIACDPNMVTNVAEAAAFVQRRRPLYTAPYSGRMRRVGARLSKGRRAVAAVLASSRRPRGRNAPSPH